jgi:predicted GIY-YIG superfamily endonuclease
MVHWVYVLECEDGYIYVGQTQRLYSRWKEHLYGKGSVNTHRHIPRRLIGLYKVGDNLSFREYHASVKRPTYYDPKFIIEEWGQDTSDYLYLENFITERYMYERRNNETYGMGNEWYKIRGGKYTYKSLDDTVDGFRNAAINNRMYRAGLPISSKKECDIVDRPLCVCGYPSEVKINQKKDVIYFVCPLKNTEWDGFHCDIDVPVSCDFWQVYKDDAELKMIEKVNGTRPRDWLINVPQFRSKIFPEPCIKCNTIEYTPIYFKGNRMICNLCYYNKYDELCSEYDKMLIKF